MTEVTEKQCTRCEETKPIEGGFYNPRRAYCVECERETAAARMRKHNKTLKGRAMTSYNRARRTAAKFGAVDTLKPLDVVAAFAFADGTCAYCGEQSEKITDLQLDHVVAFSRGGENTADNIRVCCRSCNMRKGSKPFLSFALESKIDADTIRRAIYSMASATGRTYAEMVAELMREGARNEKDG
ncbi:HNH endonuclease [Bhargavaea ginsengi]|uniref:HNH endonuclease n=1 Tax=Bhargavaea ginsengi TaxID=426757 RepID=UPI003C78ADC7